MGLYNARITWPTDSANQERRCPEFSPPKRAFSTCPKRIQMCPAAGCLHRQLLYLRMAPASERMELLVHDSQQDSQVWRRSRVRRSRAGQETPRCDVVLGMELVTVSNWRMRRVTRAQEGSRGSRWHCSIPIGLQPHPGGCGGFGGSKYLLRRYLEL